MACKESDKTIGGEMTVASIGAAALRLLQDLEGFEQAAGSKFVERVLDEKNVVKMQRRHARDPQNDGL